MQDTTWVRTFNEKNIWSGNGYICTASRMGIGTSGPAASLEITSNVVYSNTAVGDTYFQKGATNLLQGGGANTNTSIRASNRIVTDAAFGASSDRRLKANIVSRNQAEDLHTLQQLPIVDFTWQDVIGQGNKLQIGVIAQDVEGVFPQCVTQDPGPAPDVYKTMPVKWLDEHRFTVNWGESELPPVGAQLRVVAETTTLKAEVTDIQGSTVSLHTSHPHSCPSTCTRVFVWGTYVDDLRTVEYDNLACLNVSATQALAKQVQDLQTENAALRAGLASLETRLVTAGL